MDKWNLIIDVARCVNCNNCVLAAKDEFVGNDFPGYTAPHAAHGPAVIRVDRVVRGSAPRLDAAYLPRMCNHCDDAPCIKAGGADGAVRKRPDGIVIFDPVKARGRRDLVAVCPHDAVVWNEELQLPQNWFFDAHLLDAGETQPRCAQVCPTRAIEAVKITDEQMAERVTADALRSPVTGCKPRVYYRNLHRIDTATISGSISASINGRLECVEGGRVVLRSGGQEINRTATNAFGDFCFDNVDVNSAALSVVIEQEGFLTGSHPVAFQGTSIDLGDIMLKPSG